MTSEGLGELFEGGILDMCAKRNVVFQYISLTASKLLNSCLNDAAFNGKKTTKEKYSHRQQQNVTDPFTTV